jgi:hypothetical protein
MAGVSPHRRSFVTRHDAPPPALVDHRPGDHRDRLDVSE